MNVPHRKQRHTRTSLLQDLYEGCASTKAHSSQALDKLVVDQTEEQAVKAISGIKGQRLKR
jgi:hypothetical protein